jgi:membrane associated rhomboid family serine protease
MGIYDREYYRDKTRGSGWLSGGAPACKVLIAINVAAFVLQKMFPGSFDELFRADSQRIFHGFPPEIWRLLTATFLHAGPWHILFNMLFLWMVGREMESFYGTADFTALYIAAAIFSSLCWAVADSFDRNPGYMVGASGAVMAVVVLYTLYYPRREVLFMFVIPVEMWLLLVIYLGYNLIQFLNPNPAMDERTAYSAHLGGAAFGYLFKVGDLRLSRLQKLFRRRPRLRIVPAEPREPSTTARPSMGPTWSPGTAASTRPAPTAVIPEELFDEKLDEILVKIAREGRGSLSEDENRILDEASRRARNRRSERI